MMLRKARRRALAETKPEQVAALGSLFVCLTLGGNVYNWKHPAVITTAVTAILSVAGFAYVETKVANPVLPPYLFLAFPTGNLMCAGFLASLANSTVRHANAKLPPHSPIHPRYTGAY